MDFITPINSNLTIEILFGHWEKMRNHVISIGSCEESCGILAGINNRSTFVFPATNILHSPGQFQIDPREQLTIFKELDQNGWDLMAIYHSHPNGSSYPSDQDVNEAFYPEAINLIWSFQSSEWDCRAYKIIDNRINNAQIVLLNE
ncbi:MAG: M67 family metallopeptidase [Chloroflexota bacterium]